MGSASPIVGIAHEKVTDGLILTYGSFGTYAGFDQFGRVVDQLWEDDTTFDEYTYAHDAVGNRTSRDNELHADFDETYSYDEVYRLIASERADGFDQDWTLDGLGNWAAFDDDGDMQTRETNDANEIGNITGGPVTPGYDAAGNMTAMPQPGSETDRLFAVYDGWNRLVKVYADDGDSTFEPGTGDDLMVTYEHDGLGRRIEKAVTADGGGARAVDYFYNESWQLLESQEVVGETTSVDQYIWDESYIDAPVVRYHDSDNDGTYEDPNDYVHYHTWDANQNVTAAIDEDGTVVERYVYTPYGEVTVYDSSWANGAAPSEDGPLYAGYFFDAETGLYHVRNRMYHPTLGNFIVRDPIESDLNLYRYCTNNPVICVDPSGLKWRIIRRKDRGIAECCRENSGDTVTTLAEQVGLDVGDYRKWLTEKNGRYYVPNTIYAVWAGEDVLKFPLLGVKLNLGKNVVKWDADVKYLQKRGFFVVNTDAPRSFLTLIHIASRDKMLHGLFFWGHGAPHFIAKKDQTWRTTYSTIGRALEYKMGFGLLNACFSDHKAGDKNIKYWFPNKPLTIQVFKGPLKLGGRNLVFKKGIFWGAKGILSPFQRLPIFNQIKHDFVFQAHRHPADILKPGDQGTNL